MKEVIRLIKGWRTILVFGIQGVVFFLSWDQLATLVDPFYIVEANMALAMFMRWITTGPVGTGE